MKTDGARSSLSIEEGLRRSKGFLELVLDSINDALSVIDVKVSHIVEVNKVFPNSSGLEAREVPGTFCCEVHRDSLPRLESREPAALDIMPVRLDSLVSLAGANSAWGIAGRKATTGR